MTLNKLLGSPEDFHQFMTQIDNKLKKDGIKISARPLAAAGEFARVFKIQIALTPTNDENDTVVISRIQEWYKKYYSKESLRLNLSPGSVVIVIKSDPYRLHIPFCIGMYMIICDPTFANYPDKLLIRPGENPDPLKLNVLECIENLTEAMARELNEIEQKGIIKFATRVFTAIYSIDAQDLEYKNAIADLKMAADNILAFEPQYGLAQWSALQFCEKLMKGYVKKFQQNHPHTHDLFELNDLLIKHGIRRIPPELLDIVQVEANVRYNDKTVTKTDALRSHHAALEIAYFLTAENNERKAWFFYE